MKPRHILAATALAAAIASGGIAPAGAAPSFVPPTAKVTVKADTKYTSANVHLRAKAGTQHRSLRVIKKGSSVSVQKTKGAWAQVKVGGKTGWVSTKYLTSKARATKSAVKNAAMKPSVHQSFSSKARVILNRHGCKSSKIKLNDQRLGRYANGAADWNNNTVLLRTSMPAYRLNYVAAHECMHMRQYRAYGGNVKALSAAMNKIYGGRGYTGLERNADCMTRAVGIKVTNKAYASSCTGAKGKAAKRVLAGKRA